MKISLNHLESFLEFPQKSSAGLRARADELRQKLPLAGIEIGAFSRPGEALKAVIVGQILEFSRHPNADKLNVCKVATGSGEPLQIVCGAPNVKVGAKVALAPVGCELPGGLKIQQAAIRGVDSFGMLCSESELGLSETSAGIIHLPESVVVGQPFVQALGLDDEIWDVELTPDRADCLSFVGLAREVARLVGAKVMRPHSDDVPSESDGVSLVAVEVQAVEECPYYSAYLLDLDANGPSVFEIRSLLEKLGSKSHDAIVDATNLTLLEWGCPLHAFDADTLVGSKVFVRRARAGEKLKTLDGVERELFAEDLVIADAEKPVALAGVIGGFDSAVTAKTRRVLLEAAVFNPISVRKTARRHKLHTEASHRFERGIDAGAVKLAAARAIFLMKDQVKARLRGAPIEKITTEGQRLQTKHVVQLDLRLVRDVAGIDVEAEHVVEKLKSALIESSVKSANVVKVDVPTWRLDLVREIDLVEEVARLVGFDKIPEHFPSLGFQSKSLTESFTDSVEKVRHRLLEGGLTEVMPYAFIADREKAWAPHHKSVELENPLSAEWKYLRSSLTSGLIGTLARHVSLAQFEGGFFEVGNVFEAAPATGQKFDLQTRESLHAGWAFLGSRKRDYWAADKKAADRRHPVDLFEAKGVLERLAPLALTVFDGKWSAFQVIRLGDALENEGLKSQLSTSAAWIPTQILHPGRSALVLLPGKPPGEIVGYLGELHPSQKRDLLNLPAGNDVGASLGELRLSADILKTLGLGADGVRAQSRGKVSPSRRLPIVERDLALVYPKDKSAGDLEKALRKALGAELLEIECTDLFDLGSGQVSLAWKLKLQGAEKTFTDEEIASRMDKALKAAAAVGGTLRS